MATEKRNEKEITPLLKDKKEILILVDSLTKVNNIKYVQPDTSEVIGWFKYVFYAQSTNLFAPNGTYTLLSFKVEETGL